MNKSSKRSISPVEYGLMERLQQSGMSSFTAGDAASLMGWDKGKAYKVCSRLKGKGLVKAFNGRYALVSICGDYDVYSVASNLVWPSYISFWTALSYYKYTEQLPSTIFVATTRQKKDLRLENGTIKFVRIAGSRFFGYRKTDDTIIAEKEKALVDSLLLPRYAGGIAEAGKCLKNAWEEVDKETLVGYALKMKNKTLLKRLGYLIEKNKLTIDAKLLDKLERNIGRGYSKLDPTLGGKGGYDNKWKLMVNV
ncbi:MAG: hypothetical protein JW724_03390 [Candidatus Altiarchaeota archaeon]|nr:hypothetical protein [Candidatus Altiarchaeota archaeon]